MKTQIEHIRYEWTPASCTTKQETLNNPKERVGKVGCLRSSWEIRCQWGRHQEH